ncbi:MAG: hypothetical protein KTU85_04870 [Acidimicrobiia bacterium]|nr:hypothetical protein [Acidimicrobiia bacterium]
MSSPWCSKLLQKLTAIFVIVILSLGNFLGLAAASTNYLSYDGCDWSLSVDRSSFYLRTVLRIDIKEARTTDLNGGCRHVTAWLRKADGSSMVRSGPTTKSYAIAVDSNSGDRQGKGQVTTWEHDWVQYSGWVDD